MAQYRGRTLRVLWNDGERDVWWKALVWDVHGADEPAPLLTLFYEATAAHPAHVSYSRQHAGFLRDLNQDVDVAWELLEGDGEEASFTAQELVELSEQELQDFSEEVTQEAAEQYAALPRSTQLHIASGLRDLEQRQIDELRGGDQQ